MSGCSSLPGWFLGMEVFAAHAGARRPCRRVPGLTAIAWLGSGTGKPKLPPQDPALGASPPSDLGCGDEPEPLETRDCPCPRLGLGPRWVVVTTGGDVWDTPSHT